MRFEEKLKNQEYEALWQEYCGFLDLDIESYMGIQKRLMVEQIRLWSQCELGKQLLKGKNPSSIEEFRQVMPLTTYVDYADILLQKKGDMLPDTPIIWIQTTWEGGKHPVKVAPYTKGMLEVYRNNIISILMLSTSSKRGEFDISVKDKVLYGLAPLPYATGLIPLALNDEIGIGFLPPVKEAANLSFSERNKKGFRMGLASGIDYFFGMGSVAYYISLSVASLGRSSGSGTSVAKTLLKCSPSMVKNLLKAKYASKKEGKEMKPKDIFHLKGFIIGGTDNQCYKDDLEELWGVRPLEIFAGTEPSCVGTESWVKNGLYFFPDTCFYEFIPEDEMNRSLNDPSYQPKTCLMDEVLAGEKYEIVLSLLKGGAFMRYRVGDVYRCLGTECAEDKTKLPRFQYVDRIPTIIDIAGFTRISEDSIKSVIALSGLDIEDWVAAKEYNAEGRPFLHMYVELKKESIASQAISREILKEHMGIYFKYLDHDYQDLKVILGMDPLEITILKCGIFGEYWKQTGRNLKKINPSPYDLREIIQTQEGNFFMQRGVGKYE